MPTWQRGFEERFGFPLFEIYGSTDGGISVYDPIDGTQREGTCGRVTADYEIKIINASGDLMKFGEVGEICVRGKEVGLTMSRYHGMPEATFKVYDDNGWLRTGDLGTLSEDYFLSFEGRLSDSIRMRGENISSFEVEEIVLRHDSVLEVAAIGVPSELTEEDVKICVVPKAGLEISESALFDYCQERMPKFMVPRYIEVMASLPKTPTEKIVKSDLSGLEEGVWDVAKR